MPGLRIYTIATAIFSSSKNRIDFTGSSSTGDHPMTVTRRFVVAAPLALIAFPSLASEVGLIGPKEAHEKAGAGEIVLIDIRRPDEWAKTGIAGGAVPIDMRASDLRDRIDAALDGDRSKAVALICHSGVRSRHLSNAMAKAGFSNVYDVSEGMAGSGRGPGWLRRGLPVVRAE